MSLSTLIKSFEGKEQTIFDEANVEISDTGNISLNLSAGVQYTSSAGLTALREKKEATKVRHKAIMLKSSLLH